MIFLTWLRPFLRGVTVAGTIRVRANAQDYTDEVATAAQLRAEDLPLQEAPGAAPQRVGKIERLFSTKSNLKIRG